MGDNKIKILEVVTVPTEKSGIPNVAFNIMGALPREDVELGYVAINDPSEFFKDKLADLGARLFVIPRKLTSPWNYVVRLAKVAKGYDVMHVHGNSATMVLEMIAARIAGVKIRAAHSHSTSCSMKSIDRLARPLFHSLCNCRLACGQDAGTWLFGERHFEVIRNGIDTSEFRFDESRRKDIRSQLGLADEYLIGNIANFLEVKNHRFLIEIMRALNDRRRDIKLLLLGDGELAEQIKADVRSKGLEDVVFFAGSVSNPADYMSAMDFIIMPSIHEGLPLTLIEEQANGLSAMVSDAITKEADLTGNLTYMSLGDSADKWTDKLELLIEKAPRNSSVSEKSIEKIIKQGYDISSSANSLIELFRSYPG
ncbi:MAG: glycosyltransferase [Muribaculaceae bacterium]|nr:glycosyltransferase [Muribaculaceae bacterium]